MNPIDPALEAELKEATPADVQAALSAAGVRVAGFAGFTARLRSARLGRLTQEALARMQEASADLSEIAASPLPEGATWAEFETRRQKWEEVNKRFDAANADLDRLYAEAP